MRRLFPFILLMVSCVPLIVPKRLPRVPLVRVLILDGRDSVTLSSNSSFRVRMGGRIKKESSQNLWKIKIQDTGLIILINDSLRVLEPSLPIYISTDSAGSILVEGRAYRGDVKISRNQNGKIRVINILPLEDYLFGVVPCEIGTKDPEVFEAIKAQAVAARSYALRKLEKCRDRDFDLYGSSRDQVYGGKSVETPLGTKAVLETRGEVGIFKGEIINAMYHSTCGGVTADVSRVFNTKRIPYLRSINDVPPHWFWQHPRPFCSSSPKFSWNRRIPREKFFSLIMKLLQAKLSNPKDLRIERIIKKKAKSKRPVEWKVISNYGSITISSVTLRKIFNLPSNYFDFKIGEDSVMIKGYGYGHGVGMCQWGAMEMARRGYNYKKILSHYYRGVKVYRIY